MKQQILICFLLLILTLTACSDSDISYYNDKTVELTAEQETLLSEISVNEDRVQEGELFSWQKRVIYQYNYVMDYLQKKYPSYDFQIVDCTPMSVESTYADFMFVETSNPDLLYDCYVYGNTKFDAYDDFYGYIIKDEFEGYIVSLLESQGISNAIVSSIISTVRDETFCEGMDLQPIYDREETMQQHSVINVVYYDTDYVAFYETIKQIIVDSNLYGSYKINILDATGVVVYNDSFNTFE